MHTEPDFYRASFTYNDPSVLDPLRPMNILLLDIESVFISIRSAIVFSSMWMFLPNIYDRIGYVHIDYWYYHKMYAYYKHFFRNIKLGNKIAINTNIIDYIY